MIFADRMHLLTDQLDHDQLVLIPTDGVWSVAISIESIEAYHRLIDLKKNASAYPITVLVNSIRMLKQFFPKLHPRVETLLLYHERPLTIVYPSKHSRLPDHLTEYKTVAVRYTLDPFCQRIIDLMNNPIVISAATNIKGYFPRKRADIPQSIILAASYICEHRKDDTQFSPEVVVSYNSDGELVFLRK